MASTTIAKKMILGRGCDPVRAKFAKDNWEPLLNAGMDFATSDEMLLKRLTSGTRYDVFFVAPGQCQLIRMGLVNLEAMKSLVHKHQPWAKFLLVEDVTTAVSQLAAAIGNDNCNAKDVAKLSNDWPFVD